MTTKLWWEIGGDLHRWGDALDVWPVGLPSAPSNLRTTTITTSTVSLAWNAAKTNTSQPITSYRVYKNGAFVSSTTAKVMDVGGMAPNTTATYQVSAVNAAGEGPKTLAISATTQQSNNPSTTLLGMTVPKQSNEASLAVAWDNRISTFGKVRVVRDYYSSPPANFVDTATQLALDHGCKGFVYTVSYGMGDKDYNTAVASLNSIISGSKNAELTNWAKTVPANCSAWFGIQHEFDNNQAQNGYTSTQWTNLQALYKSAWTQFAVAIRAGAALNTNPGVTIRTTMITTAGVIHNEGPNYPNFYTLFNNAAIDVIGMDEYNVGRKHTNARGDGTKYPTPVYTPATNLFDDLLILAAREGKTWGIGETGSPRLDGLLDGLNYDMSLFVPPDPTGSGRAAWITQIYSYFANASIPADYICYWNTVTNNGDFSYFVSVDPEKAAMRAFYNAQP